MIAEEDQREAIESPLDETGPLTRVLLVPPGYTKRNSGSGELTSLLWEALRKRAALVARGLFTGKARKCFHSKRANAMN